MGRKTKAHRTRRNGRSGYPVQIVLDAEDLHTLDAVARRIKTTRTGAIRDWLRGERESVKIRPA